MVETPINRPFAVELRKHLEGKGKSHFRIATDADLNPGQLSKYASGENIPRKVERVRQLAKACGASEDDLIDAWVLDKFSGDKDAGNILLSRLTSCFVLIRSKLIHMTDLYQEIQSIKDTDGKTIADHLDEALAEIDKFDKWIQEIKQCNWETVPGWVVQPGVTIDWIRYLVEIGSITSKEADVLWDEQTQSMANQFSLDDLIRVLSYKLKVSEVSLGLLIKGLEELISKGDEYTGG